MRTIRLALVAALLGVPAVALGASGSSQQVWVTACYHEVYKPKEIVLACGDAGELLERLRWSKWTTTKATGKGTYAIKTCTPNCASGGFDRYPANVALTRPRTCPSQKHRVFGHLILEFGRRRPPHTRRIVNRSLGCPY